MDRGFEFTSSKDDIDLIFLALNMTSATSSFVLPAVVVVKQSSSECVGGM